MKYVPVKKASEILGYHEDTLRRMANAGKIEVIRTEGGHRRYNVQAFIDGKSQPTLTTVCYCRVSSKKQKDDLERQVASMRSIYPNAEIIRDIGSGLNFKRPGLRSLLDRLLEGDQLSLIVAHRDRLARFGIELFRYLVESNGGELVVLDQAVHSPTEELRSDLLSILHIFSCRMHGLRRYHRQIKEDPCLSNAGTESNAK
ncbi:IS607 family transposase [Candidatus Poribacteria bacterium]|nr:IS607 family transposase [Candidatus Poribacteria bacterium]